MERGTKNRVFAIVVLVLTIAVNVYGMLTLPAITAVGGALTKGGEIVELPTWLLLAACLLFVLFMCIKQMFEKREENDVMWRIVNPILLVLNAVLVFIVL